MSRDRIKDLLHEVADGVEPGDRLEAIRSATSDRRRTGRGWWAAGCVGLVAASVVIALALTTGGTPRVSEPDPAEPAPTTTASDPTRTGSPAEVFVYYAGETPDGQRLYRELRSLVSIDQLSAAADALSLAPEDPDYVNLWPSDAIEDVSFDGTGDEGQIGVIVDPAYRDRPASMTPAQASLGVEAVVRTLQAATDSTAAVQFYADGNPIDQVLGVPTSEPLTTGSDLAVLAHVSLTDPSEGQQVDNDQPFTVTGLGNSFEGNIVTRIQRWEGTYIVDELPAIAGTYEDKLFPFEVTFALTDVPPGDYVVISRTDDPSGEGRFHTDSRRITVVD
jgi:hypothetical protein